MISRSPTLAPPYSEEQFLEAAFNWNAARAELFKWLKDWRVILYQCLQMFERPSHTEKDWTKDCTDWLRTRHSFAYEVVWRCFWFSRQSQTHRKVQRQCCHLDYVHKSDFLPEMQKAVCKTRGMLTTTVLSVQGKPLFFAQDKGMFQTIFCADSDASWPKSLLFTIQFCMVYLKSHTKVLVISVILITWRHF